MKETIVIFKKRLSLYLLNIVVVSTIILQFLSLRLMPVFYEYGLYQCTNITTKIINAVVSSRFKDDLKENIVSFSKEEIISIDFNTAILNSIASSTVKLIQLYFYKLEQGELDQEMIDILELVVEEKKLKKGIVYEIPFSRAFNNLLISNIGFAIPVRYQLMGQVTGQITSSIKEYGINNALLEINLEIKSKMRVSVPMKSEETNVDVSVPIVMKLVQGEIPNYYFGTSILGEV